MVDAASDATSWIGKRVACGAGVSCSECAWCRRGRTNLCERYYTIGLSTDGGLAQFVAAPARICREIPPSCRDEDAVLAQPLAVGMHALRRAGLSSGDTVVLLGVGAIGAFICAGLAGHDGDVTVMDVDQNRLDAAAKLGATQGFRLERDATPQDVRDLLPGGANLVFETSGVLGGAARAFALAARGGTVVLVGLNKTPQAFNLADLVLREVDVKTTVAHICDQDIPEALSSLASARSRRSWSTESSESPTSSQADSSRCSTAPPWERFWWTRVVAKVALLGTGRMGAAMASRLVGSGHQLALWNRTTATAAELADRLGPSVQVAPDPAAAVARCGLVLSVFADGDTTCAVLLDAVRAESWLPGVVVCDLGTSGLDAAKALSAGLRTAGVGFVDAPVSGSVPTVLAGELLVMASGDEHDVALLRPVLAAFARKVMFVGPAGSGQIMKLSVNLVVHGLNAVVSEALQLAESTGIARKDAYDVLQESVVAAPFVKYKRAAFLDNTQPVAMSLNLVHKDLTLIAGLAASTGSRVPVTASVARAVGDALDEGMGALDMAALSHPRSIPTG